MSEGQRCCGDVDCERCETCRSFYCPNCEPQHEYECFAAERERRHEEVDRDMGFYR